MEGDCHFIDGNIKARRIIDYVKKVLMSIGVEPERVAMYNLSAYDGPLFAKYAEEFHEIIKGLGPVIKPGTIVRLLMADANSENSSIDSKVKIKALREERSSLIERNKELLKKQNNDTGLIKKALKDGPKIIPELAKETGLKGDLILYYISAMKKYGEVTESGHSGAYFMYALIEKKNPLKK
jgi:hypothetical protein